MKKLALLAIAGCAFLYSCKKTDSSSMNTATVADSAVIKDFVNVIALPQYQNLYSNTSTLNTALITLNTNTTDSNLAVARQAWKDTRTSWEQCEGYLFGPVEDNNYDPDIDTWPVDRAQLDSIVANIDNIQVSQLPQSLRGFHPIEYIIWGANGNAAASSITANQKKYMMKLSADMLGITDSLNASWQTSGVNFQQELLQAGKKNPSYTRFSSRQDVLLAIAGAMSDICGEVGDSKIHDPFIAQDSTQAESPFSHNSITDFTNNITGARNVYICSFNNQTGTSLSSWVATKNASLDNKIKQQFAIVLADLNGITGTFEEALYSSNPNYSKLQTAMKDLATLQGYMDTDLKTCIQTYVKD